MSMVNADRVVPPLLPDEHNLLRAVAHCVNDIVFVKDLEGRHLFVNEAGARFFALAPAEVVGKTNHELLEPQTAEAVEATDRATYAAGRELKFEQTLTGPNGTRVFLTSKAPYRDAEGRLIGLLGISCDITERKRMEEELRRSHQETVDILESITDGFYTLDREWRLTYINRRAEEFLRMSRQTDIGRNIWKIYPDAVGSIFQEKYQKVMDEHVSVNFEAEYDGRWWELNVYPKSDGLSVFFRDITERTRACLALTQSEARYSLVFKATADVIYDWDNRTDQVFFNDAIESAFLYSKEKIELTGNWWADHVHPEDRRRVLASIWTAFAGTAVNWSAEYRFLKGDGTYVDVLDRAYIERDSSGRAMRTIGVMQDLTQQKRTEQLESERQHLRDAVAAMETVLGVVGHELRTPLAGLMAMSDYVLDPESAGTPERENFLKGMSHEIDRMSRTVDDLLEAARLNSGRARWNWEEFELEPVCREALETIRPLIDSSKVALSLRFEPGPATMWGDAAALRRLIINVLSNARKHTSAGSVDLKVSSAEFDGARWTEIEVSDTGGGITPEVLERLGEAFALNSGVVGSNFISGTGLGLAICKGIAEAHGGSVHFASDVGRGTRVTVRLRADLEGPAPVRQRLFSGAGESNKEAA